MKLERYDVKGFNHFSGTFSLDLLALPDAQRSAIKNAEYRFEPIS